MTNKLIRRRQEYIRRSDRFKTERRKTMLNYRPIFEFASGERVGNAQVFASHDEAWASAESRFARWTMPTAFSVDETSDPVNYKWDTELGDVSLPLIKDRPEAEGAGS